MPFDSIGQPLEEGDIVLIPQGNTFLMAKVKQIQSGVGSNIVQQGNQVAQAQPLIILEILLPRLVPPDQRVPDTIKIGHDGPPKSAIAE